jgi:hypothetical protein
VKKILIASACVLALGRGFRSGPTGAWRLKLGQCRAADGAVPADWHDRHDRTEHGHDVAGHRAVGGG